MPGNPRYQPVGLRSIFGYDNLYKKIAEVELATLETLYDLRVIPAGDWKKLSKKTKQEILSIRTTVVEAIEKKITHHDIRAWVRCAQQISNKRIARWIHIPLTSYDVIDTARILQFKEAYQEVLKPDLVQVVQIFIKLIEDNSQQIQIGRTHGQHALPITVGFWLATILHRLLDNFEKLDSFHSSLVGKISGAVGAHNAQIALNLTKINNKKTFEELVLAKLNLQAAKISTQILSPEPLAYFLFSAVSLSASLGQFGRDCRQLMRSEIAEVAESFEPGQVGSSTMAHKRNPINFENLEGMWLRTKNEFGKVLDTLISEHQRDLVGSSVARDYPIIIINLQQQLSTLLKENKKGLAFLERLFINSEACQLNFKKNAQVIMAEPLYIALQMAGYEDDAHELVNRKLVPLAQSKNISLIQALEQLAQHNKSLQKIIRNIPADLWRLLKSPEKYIGDAPQKSLEIVKNAKIFLKQIK